MYYRHNGKWLEGGTPSKGSIIKHKVDLLFEDTLWYYANCIDYVRITMTIFALIGISLNIFSNLLLSFLIFGSVLLDWIDGPIARYFEQTSIIGCGWDWLADLFAQYCLAIWVIQTDANPILKLYIVLITAIEISTGMFDFGMSVGAVYPKQTTRDNVWYLQVENWLTPDQSYSYLGTACWLINTTFAISICSRASGIVTGIQAPFAILYGWHECCQLYFILTKWFETSAILQKD